MRKTATTPRDPPRLGGPRSRGVEVILPALNEEQAVGSVIDHIPTERLRRMGYEVRVWVVDGRSTDSTLRIAREKGANVFLQSGEGKGKGVRQAIDHLLQTGSNQGPSTRVFVMLDADGSYPAECIPEFLGALESGRDVVLGSRFLGEVEGGAISPLNRLGNRLLSRLASLLFGRPVTDVCTGMWAFQEDAIRKFGLAANGFDLEADLFASCCELGVRIGELPIDFRCRIGEPKLIPLRTGVLIAWRLLMKRVNHRPTAHVTRRSAWNRGDSSSLSSRRTKGLGPSGDSFLQEALTGHPTEDWA